MNTPFSCSAEIQVQPSVRKTEQDSQDSQGTYYLYGALKFTGFAETEREAREEAGNGRMEFLGVSTDLCWALEH